MLWTGLIQLTGWQVLVVTLGLTHLTFIAISLYLHRGQAHRAVSFHPALAHVFRAWLWLTTGMSTLAWVAVHRKHHAHCETAEDPHSPAILGIWRVLFGGVGLYRVAAADPEVLQRYGQGTPEDWLERRVYHAHGWGGVVLLALLNSLVFGGVGLVIWAVQMLWTPLWAAGVINGLGHYIGYRVFNTDDQSTNLCPLGLLIVGEELHNNHHAYSASAKFSVQPWEFDIGWVYLCVLRKLGLAKVKRVVHRVVEGPKRAAFDLETVRLLLRCRFELMDRYWQEVLVPLAKSLGIRKHAALRRLRRVCSQVQTPAELAARLKQDDRLGRLVQDYQELQQTIQLGLRFGALCRTQRQQADERLAQLRQWCQQASAAQIGPLTAFVERLRCLSV